ncbi:hypothetical protein D3C76_1341250 [compost metagenome]
MFSRTKDSCTKNRVKKKVISSRAPVTTKVFCSPIFSAMKPPRVGPNKEPAILAVESVPSAYPECSLSVWVAISVVQAVP